MEDKVTQIINSLYVLKEEDTGNYLENFQDDRFLPVATYKVEIAGDWKSISVFSLYRAKLVQKYFPGKYVIEPLVSVLQKPDLTGWESLDKFLIVLG